ncbi:MAG: hypothetical protein IJH39_11700 [Clostridia bacterium]|nr:hypothetical protein [Clostridia bacterium]
MNEVIEMLQEQEAELVTKLKAVRKEIKELRLKKDFHLDFTGKFIKYNDPYDSPIYMYVDWIREDETKIGRFDYAYTFQGHGFYGEFTGYEDATSFCWNYMFEFDIYGDELSFEEKVKYIEVIDKDEFQKAFDENVKSLIEYNNRRMKHCNEAD